MRLLHNPLPVTAPRHFLLGVLLGAVSFMACSNGSSDDSNRPDGSGGQAIGDGDGSGDGDSGDGDGDGDGDWGGDGDGDGGDGDGAPVVDVCDDLKLCGPGGTTDCCKRVTIEGGTFPMGTGSGTDACPPNTTCGAHESPEHAVQIDAFALDAFEVTVGRLRPFVEAFDEISLSENEGAHPEIVGSGWQELFDDLLPQSAADLRESLACDSDATWSDTPEGREALPVNCVNWAVAFAFCAKTGGRLPTEAEWEYAAAGGSENRLYPWGGEAPDASRARFYPSGQLAKAGEVEGGEGRYGNFDLAGNVWEWALDWLDTGWYSGDGAACENCARVTSGTHRVIRGGAYTYQDVTLRAAARSGEVPGARDNAIGFRCAYSLE